MVYSKQAEYMYVLGRSKTTVNTIAFFTIINMGTGAPVTGTYTGLTTANRVGYSGSTFTSIAIDPSSTGMVDVIYCAGFTDGADGTTDAVIARFEVNLAASPFTLPGAATSSFFSWMGSTTVTTDDRANAVAVHPTSRDVYVAGFTRVVDLGLGSSETSHAFITRFIASGSTITQSTTHSLSTSYNQNAEEIPEQIAVSSSEVFVTGTVNSGDDSVFVYAMSSDLSTLKWYWPTAADTDVNTAGRDDRPSSIMVVGLFFRRLHVYDEVCNFRRDPGVDRNCAAAG